MGPKEKINELIDRLHVIPIGHEALLKEYIVDLKKTIEQVFSPESQYLNYLRFIKFKPDAVFVTDKELERNWHNGVTQIDNLLRVLLNDPKVNVKSSFKKMSPLESFIQQSLGQLNQSIIEEKQRQIKEESQKAPLNPSESKKISGEGLAISDRSEDAVKQSLGSLQQSIIQEHPEISPPVESQNVLSKQDVSKVDSQEQKNSEVVAAVPRVLYVTLNDELLNSQVVSFLRLLPIELVGIPEALGNETVMDRINQCQESDCVVLVLSANSYMYQRTHQPADANLVASQSAVFQLGYLAAKHGRDNMVILYQEEPGFVMPTEYFDLFYVPIDPSGNWKEEIIRRVKGKQTVSESLGLTQQN